ncbi:MAG: hypothetical protein JSV44_04795, partial [Candidatus Zixiibacteriota bacterium]
RKTALKYDLTYHGMAGSVMTINNELLLTVSRDGADREARPHFFYVPRMEAMMKRPHIEKELLYDLYLSPLDVQEFPNSGGLRLAKGETDSLGDFTVTFVDFDMGSHDASGGITVAAELEVSSGGRTETARPALTSNISSKSGQLISSPVPLLSGSGYEVRLSRVLPDEGAVMLEIPGLIEAGPPDQLILDMSLKPGINLLWLGTIIIAVGLTVTLYNHIRP